MTRVVIHLESGDEVVILRGGIAREDLPESVVDAYEAKYAYRPPVTEGWFVLRPRGRRLGRARLPDCHAIPDFA